MNDWGHPVSFIHLMHIGHFEHEGRLVQFACTPTDPILRPVVRRPLDMRVVRRLTGEVGGLDGPDFSFPADWNLWIDDGYLTGDRYALNCAAIVFIVRLVRLTGCDLVDFNSRSIMRPEDFPEGFSDSVTTTSAVLPVNTVTPHSKVADHTSDPAS